MPDAAPGAPTLRVVAIHDPRYREPLLLASPLAASATVLHALYRDRWPVEQLPLAAKQMLGAARAFVHVPETCQRLPEIALLAGAILSYTAATSPAIATGFWDRRPQPTPGRLRRALAHTPFPHEYCTLPKGLGDSQQPEALGELGRGTSQGCPAPDGAARCTPA